MDFDPEQDGYITANDANFVWNHRIHLLIIIKTLFKLAKCFKRTLLIIVCNSILERVSEFQTVVLLVWGASLGYFLLHS